MSSLLEVLVTTDSNNTLWTSCIWDPHTGTNLKTYKGGGTSEAKTLSFIGSDYIAAVEKTKPILHIWPLNSHQTVQGMRFILPGKASAFAFSPDGAFCVAGIDEKIYLWQIASGNLLSIISRHYQKVVLLKFTPDGRFFVSAAEDGMVMVWSLATVAANPEAELVTQTTAGQHDPVYIFSDHSLPVADLYVSKTGMHGRLCSVSGDRSCKIYDLASGEMLLNLVFDVPLSAVTMDVLELSMFIGTTEGKIFQISLTNPPRTRDLLVNTENTPVFTGHKSVVNCLSVSLDGETLMSASNDERVLLWHIASRQPIRTIKHKGPVTNAYFTTNYPAIYNQEFKPSIVLHSLERSLETAEDYIELDVIVDKKINFWPISTGEDYEQNISLVAENEYKDNEDKFKTEIENLKKINSNLYAFAIQKEVNNIVNGNNNVGKKNKKKKK
ncbi:WD repeat-containing protein 18 [Cydia pomonella]|uniref:WD repeat-containing protein 18 n=1 Tax=Cydia pomonella TaxID=82600 RepID=UPI002ADE834E|nr:WD repeat-containing protein 18 [Cydia pomonella]